MKQNRCKTALDNVCKNKVTATTNNEDTKKEAIRKFIKSRRH